MPKVLVVDNEQVVSSWSALLVQEGYDVCGATTVAQALQAAHLEHPDLILLNVTLPEIDGLEVCRRIRTWSAVPIIMLSGRTSETDKVIGLEVGGDDYLTQPVGPRELVSRVRAHLRRLQPGDAQQQTLRARDIVMDLDRRRVTVRGREIGLSPKEFGLLQALMGHPDRALGRDVLLSRVWGDSFFGSTRTVDVHIRWLRKKIEENPQRPNYIQTVRGIGYKLSTEGRALLTQP